MGMSVSAGSDAHSVNTAWIAGLRLAANCPFKTTNMHTSMTFVSAHVLYNNGTAISSDTTLVNVTGSASSDVVTPNVAVLLQKKTALAGPKYRGRCFIPSGTCYEANVDQAGILLSGFQATLQTNWDGAVGSWSIATPSLVPVIIHRDGSGSTLITSLHVSQQVATLRKRLRK